VENLGGEVSHLLDSLLSKPITGTDLVSFTNYLFFFAIGAAILLGLLFYAKRKAALVPEGRLYNMIEAGVEFIRNDVAVEIIGPEGRKYFPFIGTIFFFILIQNLVGLIPGSKPGTGTMGVSVALAITVFVYFNLAGIRAQGGIGYLKGLVPHGVPWWIAWLVWLLEVISMFMRPFTLSVRLFANMYAGHIVLGIFAILTAIGAEQAIEAIREPALGGVAVGAVSTAAWMMLLMGLYLLELLVAFIQAYVFTLLTTVYISQAVHEH
jgi:F-type H+-transporting ATPase subunit a